jgi:hypothetical protein
MSVETNPIAVDMIRWTFSIDPESRESIEAHLVDLGLDVVVVGEGQFHVTWEEPDRDMAEVTSELWDLNGEPFEITQEEFHRLGHFLIHPDDAGEAQAA